MTQAIPRPAPGTSEARERPEAFCTLKDVRDALHPAAGVQIWDVRSDEEYTGASARGNRRAGHVPGAIHLEWTAFIDETPSHRLVPLEDARRRLGEAGVDPEAVTVTYCQGGIRAALAAFILRLLGNTKVSVYDGSMGEWANLEDTPLV